MNYLLDTNVISDVISKQPNLKVSEWLRTVDEQRTFLSVVTIGEIKRGIERLPTSARKEKLLDWLDGELLIRFRGRILTIDLAVTLTWGTLNADMVKIGRKLPVADSLIAATVLHHRLSLVTRNGADFAETGVSVLNPWD